MALTEDQKTSITKIKETFAHFNGTMVKKDDPVIHMDPCHSTKQMGNTERFDTDLMRRARIIDATSAGTAVFEIDIGKTYSNWRGIMHGGAAALILDQFTTAAFIPLTSIDDLHDEVNPPGGVTRSISITYLRPLPLPTIIRVEAKVIQTGRSVSLVRGNITSRDGEKVYFTGEQHKVSASVLSTALKTSKAGKTKL